MKNVFYALESYFRSGRLHFAKKEKKNHVPYCTVFTALF
jgi:hypothetical protein